MALGTGNYPSEKMIYSHDEIVDTSLGLKIPDYISETDKGLLEQISLLGYDVPSFFKKIAGKHVIDIGGGRGRLAAEVELHRLNPNLMPPASFRTINIAYKRSNYDHYYRERDRAQNAEHMLDLVSEQDDRVLKIPYNDPTLIPTWDRVREQRLPVDWYSVTDYQTIATSSVDYIFSCFGFPYYSDLKEIISDKVQAEASKAIIAFNQLNRILVPGGTMDLHTNILNENWPSSPTIDAERNALQHFFQNKVGLRLVDFRKGGSNYDREFGIVTITKD
jgi:hypothetical protein